MKKSWFNRLFASKPFQSLLRVFLLLLALYFIQARLNENLWEAFKSVSTYGTWFWLPVYFALWLANFWLDIRLWQITIRPLAALRTAEAFSDNLKFYAYSFVSPANSGGLVARMSRFIGKQQKTTASLLSAKLGLARYLSRLSIGLGCALLLFLYKPIGWVLASCLALLCFILFTLVAYHWRALTQWVPWRNWLRRLKLLSAEEMYVPQTGKNDNLFLLFALACLRFLVYNSQFAVLLLLFGASFNPEVFLAIPAFFLLTNLLPSFPAADFLIKGAVGLAVFQYFEENPALLLISATTLWFSNWALPALAGIFVGKESGRKLKG